MDSLPEFIRTQLSTIITAKCYTTIFEDFNITNVFCLKLMLSKALGYGIVLGSAIVKVPQIYKIIAANSVQGLALPSFLLETFASAAVIAYNYRNAFPFSTWGESIPLALQNFIILALIYAYTNRLMSFGVVTAVLASFAWALLNPQLVSMEQLALVQASTIPLFMLSRIPQIYENWRNGSTGQLSAPTVFLLFGGAFARVFTTVQEVDDQIILLGFVMNALLNTVLAMQIVYYWRSPAITAKKRSKARKNN